jgi:DNA repair exonuclease SbcCD ATPase subunit
MYPKNVRTLNWMAFRGEQRVGPLPPGPIAVVGRYTENPRRSNWSGKSGWLEAIRFALTGAHRKRTLDALITHGETGFEVEVEMSTGLTISRVHPRGGPTVLRVTDPKNAPGLLLEREAAEEHLARVFRLTVSDFDNTSWFGQGDVHALCGQTSGERRAVFARWLELDRWERMGKRAMLQARDARTSLDVARAATIGQQPRDPMILRDERGALSAELVQVEGTRDEMAEAIEFNAAAVAVLANLNAQRANVQAASASLSSVRAELAALPEVVDPERFAALDEERIAERAAVDAAEKEVQAVRQLLAGRFDGQCPVTCEACPVADSVSEKRGAFVERSRLANIELGRARTKVGELSAEITSARGASEKRIRLVGQMNEATKRVRAARTSLEELERSFDPEAHRVASENAATARAERTKAEGRIGEIRAALGRLDEEERQGEAYARRVRERDVGIASAEDSARIAQLVARALGGSGIPARIAAISLAGLEHRANAILEGLGLSFSLAWERELGDPAPACAECGHVYEKRTRARECPSCGVPRSRKKSDELDVLVDDGSGEIEDVRTKSGGAKVLVASAIRLAGGMMLRERRGSPLEVAFIDEPFGELDLENRDALARMFAGLLGSVGLEQAFVVSHDAQLLAGLPARVVVTREGNTSRLDLEA